MASFNIHLHCLVLDGVYRCGADGAPAFVEIGAPTDDELHVLLQTVTIRLMKLLARRGVLIEEMRCRYLILPALSDERVHFRAGGQVELKLKTPRRDGSTHLVMSPLEFMLRLAAAGTRVHDRVALNLPIASDRPTESTGRPNQPVPPAPLDPRP